MSLLEQATEGGLPSGALLIEGKTKRVLENRDDPSKVILVSKDDITAGDGAKHDVLLGKGALATKTTCNVFRLLKECGIKVAFDEQLDQLSFSAPKCKMFPYEVVVRREAHGSYLKRHPNLAKGHFFPKLVFEFFLKTSGKKWKQYELPCDDPLIKFPRVPRADTESRIQLFEPGKPLPKLGFLTLCPDEVLMNGGELDLVDMMGQIAKDAFLVLEKAWQMLGRRLVDFKVEFGINEDGELLLADVIDNDSWRVLENGAYIDKQVYRDGGAPDHVLDNYQRVARLTDQFHLPVQRVIIWRGSDKDDVSMFERYIAAIFPSLKTIVETCSVHKDPIRALARLDRLVQEVPDSVVIALIGRSNGAGPTLAAATTVPVITVPANFGEFPDDVWSSLRAPSEVPVMTVVDPANAVLAALNILSARNSKLYMCLRSQLEERRTNQIELVSL